MFTAPASRRTPPVAVAPLLLGGRGGWRERCARCTTASRAPTAPALRGAKTGAAANELVGVADGGVISAGGARAPTWRATSSDRERPPGLALPASTTMSKTRPPTAVASTIAAAILSLSMRAWSAQTIAPFDAGCARSSVAPGGRAVRRRAAPRRAAPRFPQRACSGAARIRVFSNAVSNHCSQPILIPAARRPSLERLCDEDGGLVRLGRAVAYQIGAGKSQYCQIPRRAAARCCNGREGSIDAIARVAPEGRGATSARQRPLRRTQKSCVPVGRSICVLTQMHGRDSKFRACFPPLGLVTQRADVDVSTATSLPRPVAAPATCSVSIARPVAPRCNHRCQINRARPDAGVRVDI